MRRNVINLSAIFCLGVLFSSPSFLTAQESVKGDSALELVIQSDSASRITSIAVSRDGRLMVTGTTTGAVNLWDLVKGEKTLGFSGHESRITSTALSLDGQLLVTGSYDGKAILWNTATGKQKQLRAFSEGPSRVTSVALSSDSRLLATGTYGRKSLILWNPDTGKELGTFEGHEGFVSSVALSSDGLSIVAGFTTERRFSGKRLPARRHAHLLGIRVKCVAST